MRNWGIQKFLNHVNHEDDGYFKFSIRKSEDQYYSKNGLIWYSVYCKIADCTKSIYLEFGPDGFNPNRDSLAVWRQAKKSVKDRRKKVDTFADSVVVFQKKVHEWLDIYEDWLDTHDPRLKE